MQEWQILHPASHSCVSSPKKPERRKHEVVREGLRRAGDTGVEGERNAWGSAWLFCFQTLCLQAEGMKGGKSGTDSFSELRGDALQAKGIN